MSDSALPHTQSGVDANNTVDVFLSYNSRDREAVLKIQKMLSERGISSFLDCQHLTVGLNWRNEIEAALAKVNSVVVFISAEGFGRVQRGEKDLALDRQEFATKAGNKFPVIPILLPSAKPDDVTGFLSLNTWVDLRTGLENATAMDAIAHAINGQAPSLQTPQPEPLCPYRGLLAFTEDDAPLFYGRDAFADDLLQKARTLKLIAVVGPSGTGKSSVVQAGLLPRLRRERAPNAQWEAIIFRPGNRPFHNLASELIALYETNPSKTEQMLAANKLGEALAKNELPLDVPITEALKVTKWANRLLFIVDQFEELFTLTEEKDRKPFINLLLKAAEATPITIVLTLRADFYSQSISVSRELSDAIQQGIVNIGYVKREELRRAIVKPAESVGLQFEGGLVERILDNLEDEPGNLPLLEFALTELWEKRQGNRVTNQLYESIGGVEGSISKRAEEVFTSLAPPQQNLAIRAFTRLVRVSAASEEGTDTRQRVKLKDFNDATQSVFQPFVKARLLVTSRNEAIGEEIVEVAHEALIKNWERLKELVSKDREFLLWRQEFNFLRVKWLRTQKEIGNHQDGLLLGSDLSKAKGFLKSNAEDFNEGEKLFISKSEEAEKRPKKWLAAIGAVLLLAILSAWGWKLWDDRPASQIDKIIVDSKSLVLVTFRGINNYWLEHLVVGGRFNEALLIAKSIEDVDSRNGTLVEIAPTLAQVGQTEVALSIANSVEDVAFRSETLAKIAHALFQTGQKEAAQKITQEALSVVKGIASGYSRSSALVAIAQALAQAGQTQEALSVAKNIENVDSRAFALANVAKILAHAGQKEVAQKAAQEVLSVAKDIPSYAQVAITQALAQAGQLSEALSVAKVIEDVDYRADALVGIAHALFQTGQKEAAQKITQEALSVAKNIKNIHSRGSALVAIALALAQAGQTQEALSVVKGIESPYSRPDALVAIAQALAQAGQTQEALSVAKNIENVDSRASALANVAKVLAHAGQKEASELAITEVLTGISKLGDSVKSQAYSHVAQALAKLHDYWAAREMAMNCSSSDDKLRAYTAILREYSIDKEKISPKLFEQLDREKER